MNVSAMQALRFDELDFGISEVAVSFSVLLFLVSGGGDYSIWMGMWFAFRSADWGLGPAVGVVALGVLGGVGVWGRWGG